MTVIDRPTIDFDPWSPAYRDGWQRIAAELHAADRPLAWSDHHGGFWVLADWEEVHRAGADWETFTSVNDLDGTENGGRGIVLPQGSYRLFLSESDPPFHTDRRRLEAPFFAPKALRRWRPVARRHLLEAINGVIESGSLDLIDDIVVPTTARTTLYLLGYDADDWQDAAAAAHRGVFVPPTHPDYPRAEQERLRARFREVLVQRGKEPTGDLISGLAQGTVQGQPLTLDEGESMINALVFGGFDTTVSLTASALIWLDQHAEQAVRVREDPAFRNHAIEEFLRLWPPVGLVARTAVNDTEILGQPIAAGERVAMWLAGANRDPKKFPDPDVLDLERENARDHLSFSVGNHRCLGSPLAKLEISEMLATIGQIIPDLTIDHSAIERYPSIGAVNGYSRVPATFTPGRPVPLDEDV
jgi:cytochrome P450